MREARESNARMMAGSSVAPPAFDVRVRVQRPPAPPSPPSTITLTETDGGSLRCVYQLFPRYIAKTEKYSTSYLVYIFFLM